MAVLPTFRIMAQSGSALRRILLPALMSSRNSGISDAEKKGEDQMGANLKHSSDAPDVAPEVVIDPEAERKLVRKLDWILMPLFTLIYCTNFVDRTAIGNAKIAGMEKELGMVGFDFNIALTVFYIFYTFSDIPSNLALKYFGSVWLAGTITCFGIVSISTAFVTSFSGLIATRVFLGMAEGGTLSGLTYIVSRYYRRTELVMRIGIFFGISAPLSGAFGGLLASGLLHVGDIGSVKSWRKIFLVEGIITTGIGLLCFFIIPTDPQHTRMLNPGEKALALARIDADQAVRTYGRKEPTTIRLVLKSFNINTAQCLLSFTLTNISFQGLSLFLPTVVATLGHFTVVESQLRTVPPYLVAAVWAVIISYVSLRIKQRAVLIFASGLFMVLGYAIAIGTKNPDARYAACFFSLMGTPIGPMELAWGTENAAPDTIRAVTSAIIPGIGTLGSVIAVWTYLPADAPDYHKGNTLNLGTTSAVCLLTILAGIYIRWENAKRDRGERDYRLDGKTPRELEELGYLHPRFHYQL
ncbi:MFS general substrate transporter [Mycena belliarum]|uniref:MFS general substrate transporter n=1 Tax=Mycena belliarum TaxID=1033014 RepID=A0AAD6UAC8_9AGAR|nr:MFS general substrate transporter [Mycena belliae]